MNNRIENVREYFTRIFSRFAVRIETIPDETELIGIGVYGVPRDEMAWVRREIGDAEESLFAGFGLGLIPMVRSRETTAKHYPGLVSPWICKPSYFSGASEPDPELSLEQFLSIPSSYKHERPGSAPAVPTSGDMLLAA